MVNDFASRVAAAAEEMRKKVGAITHVTQAVDYDDASLKEKIDLLEQQTAYLLEICQRLDDRISAVSLKESA